MRISDIRHLFKSTELRMAWFIAIAADFIQILVLPVFVLGGLSPAVTVVDLAVALMLTKLLG